MSLLPLAALACLIVFWITAFSRSARNQPKKSHRAVAPDEVFVPMSGTVASYGNCYYGFTQTHPPVLCDEDAEFDNS